MARIVWIIFVVAGCASTSLSSFTDPEYTERTFRSVVVWADSADLELRQALETTLVNQLKADTGASVVRSIDVAPPTRGFSSVEIVQIFRGENIEAAITIMLADSTTPQQGGFKIFGDLSSSAIPMGAAKINLIDIDAETIAWTSTASVSGNTYASLQDARKSAARAVVRELLNIGLLPSSAGK